MLSSPYATRFMLIVVRPLCPTSSFAVLCARQRHPAPPAPHRRHDVLGCTHVRCALCPGSRQCASGRQRRIHRPPLSRVCPACCELSRPVPAGRPGQAGAGQLRHLTFFMLLHCELVCLYAGILSYSGDHHAHFTQSGKQSEIVWSSQPF